MIKVESCHLSVLMLASSSGLILSAPSTSGVGNSITTSHLEVYNLQITIPMEDAYLFSLKVKTDVVKNIVRRNLLFQYPRKSGTLSFKAALNKGLQQQ
jgi:hypothetical protein